MITADNRPVQRDHEGKPLKGITKTKLYGVWNSMNERCDNPNSQAYQWYRAKGIKVCEEWSRDNVNGFENFRQWSIDNGYSEDLTIDRIDSNGDYTPMNCRWISQKEQTRNRTSNHSVTVNGKTYRTLSEAVEALNRMEDYQTINSRLRNGWSIDEAFNEPITERNYKSNHTNPITYEGITYRSIKVCCEAYGLNYSTVMLYKHQHNTTTEEAINHYIKEREA